MPRPASDNTFHLNVRIPEAHRNALASLGRVCGLNASEMLRWVLQRALEEDQAATIAAVTQLAVAKWGEEVADMQLATEQKRLEYLQSGDAVETPDGRDITFVRPGSAKAKSSKKATTPTPDAVGV